LRAEVDYARSAVSEWLILVLLVPAIVVPVVLLVGFAGCSFRHGESSLAPIIDSAIGDGLDPITLTGAIALTWHLDPSDDATAAHTFEIERTRPDGTIDPTIPVADSPREDTGLATSNVDPGTGTVEVYKYRVLRVRTSDGDRTGWSTPASSPTFVVVFGGQNFLAADLHAPVGAGDCLIQRIEANQFRFDGSQLFGSARVQIVLHGASSGSLSIDRAYISQPAGALPYGPASDLTKIYDIGDPSTPMPFVLGVDEVKSLPIVNYVLNQNQPLLIAFDLTPAAPAQARFLDLPPPPPGQQPGVTSYLSPGAVAEAASTTRSPNYLSGPNRLVCIEVIGVGF
jgi:hypothetical protein